jgi:phage shock protein A
MLQRIWRVFLSFITLGLVKFETPELVGDQLIEEMESKERKLAEDAIGVVAYQKRLEAELAQAQKDLDTWTNRAKAAARAGFGRGDGNRAGRTRGGAGPSLLRTGG